VVDKVRVIETVYNGYRFRSRLEARWAVFFDSLGIEYEYEKEGYVLPSGNYLPDFYLRELDLYVEIKSRECALAHLLELWNLSCEFEKGVGKKLYVCGYGIPNEEEANDMCHFLYSTEIGLAVMGDQPYLWCECPVCHVLGIQFDGRSGRNRHKSDCKYFGNNNDYKNYNYDSDRIINAYTKARQARFEFGENGGI
jgi:hypothetical protein